MSKRPNILLLFSDQQRQDSIAAHGQTCLATPHMDRLVREGCRFRNAYTPNPVCVPARYNLLTGLTSRYHGYCDNGAHHLDIAIPTLPQLLSDHGYVTQAVGKMHFQPARRHHGFERMELMEECPAARRDDDYARYLAAQGLGEVMHIHGVRHLLYMSPQRSLIPDRHHGSTWVGERAADFIRQHPGDRPFFLWASWIAPHPPFDVSEEFADLYAGVDLPAPLARTWPGQPWRSAHVERWPSIPADRRPAFLRRMRELYHASIAQVDRAMGRVLAALDERGLSDDTVIIQTSDHGEMLGDLGLVQKEVPYEASVRIPLTIRYPRRFAAGSVREDFADLNDILPTALDAAGIRYPGGELPGASLFGEGRDRRHQYVEYGQASGRWVSLRDARYKLIHRYAGDVEELYDLQDDPCESRDLLAARDPAAEAVRARLRPILLERELRWGPRHYAGPGFFMNIAPYDPGLYANQTLPEFPRLDPGASAAGYWRRFEHELRQAVEREPLVDFSTFSPEVFARHGIPAEVAEGLRRCPR